MRQTLRTGGLCGSKTARLMSSGSYEINGHRPAKGASKNDDIVSAHVRVFSHQHCGCSHRATVTMRSLTCRCPADPAPGDPALPKRPASILARWVSRRSSRSLGSCKRNAGRQDGRRAALIPLLVILCCCLRANSATHGSYELPVVAAHSIEPMRYPAVFIYSYASPWREHGAVQGPSQHSQER